MIFVDNAPEEDTFLFSKTRCQEHRIPRAKWVEDLAGAETELQSSTGPESIASKMHLATATLKTRLIERLTLSDVPSWISDCASLHERAVVALSHLIQEADMPEHMRQGAFSELGLGAEALTRLFADQIPLKGRVDETLDMDVMEGYFQYPAGADNRLIIEHRRNYVFSEKLKRGLRPSCQIKIKNIRGVSTRGKAIADSDSEIRLGLRNAEVNARNLWTVSIESGAHNSDQKWRIIRPLSQAIAACCPNETNPFTYHFDNPDFNTFFASGRAAQSWFIFYNNVLLSIFRESIRPDYPQPLTNDCTWQNPHKRLKKYRRLEIR